ncbi:MAG: hypothetical protein WEB03_11625 [Nitriliruptor sp.]|uniref:hypothetical protein n=1 Tax=Nitriliruptor sp. TaxID=2448056 RepID=UPI0034A018DE
MLIGLAAGWLTLTLLTRREKRRDDDDDTSGDGSPDENVEEAPAAPRDRVAQLTTFALFGGMIAVGLGAGFLVASAASLVVDGGVLQVFTAAGPDVPPDDTGDPGDSDLPAPETTVVVTWYLFNNGGQGRTVQGSEPLITAVGGTYDVAAWAGVHDGLRYDEVDCRSSKDIKDPPGATRTGSGSGFIVTTGSTHSVCLQRQTGNDPAGQEPVGSVSIGSADSTSSQPGVATDADDELDGEVAG